MTMHFVKPNGRAPTGEPLLYKACGLDDVYLVNGFTREVIDGEEFLTIEDMDLLWKAIGLHLVTKRKMLSAKEVRFLRDHMKLTQAELGARLRVTDQTIARWEKGETTIHGSADLMIRVLFLACERAQPEGGDILIKLRDLLQAIVEQDDAEAQPIVFVHKMKNWKQEHRQVQYA